MKFSAPGYLWCLLLVPFAYFLLVWDERRRQKRFEEFTQKNLWPFVAPEIDPGARLRKVLIAMAAAVFTILALARPQWGSQDEVAKMSGLDVMVVLDVSNSMETEDVVPSRLKKSKHLLRTLAERIQGDRLGLIVFAGGASIATPLTTDTEYFLEQLQIQNPKMIPTQGTNIGLGIDTALRAMERGAVQSGQGSQEVPSRAIVLISDGEDFEGMGREAAARAKAQGVRVYVFGVGTEKGGPVPVRDDSGSLVNYKRDRAGKPVVSAFHADDLVQLAATGGGRYWNVTSDESEINDLLKDLGALTRGEFAEHHYVVYKERYQYPLAVAVFLIFLELSFSARSARPSTRYSRQKAAGALVLMGAFGMGLLSSEAHATGIETYRDNKKGIEAYKAGKMEEAQKEFGAAQALDPHLPELQYNQGLVHMQQGDMDAAIHDFQQAARDASKSHSKDFLGENYFNLGAAYTKKGDIKNALQSYLSAIDSAQNTGNSQLEQDARKNIELLVQQQKQQQQKKQQEQEQKDQQQKQQDQQQGQPDKKKDGSQNQKDQKDQKDKGDQEDKKRYDSSSSRGKKFESQKLTPDDAERVLSELKNREGALQSRQGQMKKQNGNQGSQGNDW